MRTLLPPKDDAYQFKPILVEIEEEPVSPLARTTLWLVISTIVFFVAWSILGQVDIVVTAPGKVIPDGHAKVLQPLDSGIVSNILVKEGDYVKKGQLLMEIDPSVTADELRSNVRNYSHTRMEIQRLEATLHGRGFSGGGSEEGAAQAELYRAANSGLERQLQSKQEELTKTDEQQRQTEADLQKNKELLANATAKQKRLAPVIDLIARDEWDRNENDLVAYKGNLDQAEHKLKELDHQKAQLSADIGKIQADFQTQNLRDLSDKQKDATNLDGRVQELTFKHSKQALRAPIDGYVDAVFVHTIGGVVSPAEKLMSIIPANTPLIIDASVSNQDIGFVETGMPVQIKADTFDFQKYGMYEGKVKVIGKDSHDDERKMGGGSPGAAQSQEKKLEQVYEVLITPTKSVLQVEGKNQPLTPGMTLSAEVKVGKRRIIEFFIYPLIKYWHDGISVR